MKILLASSLLLVSSFAFGGICELTIDRTPCAGKEAAAYEPYKGKGTGDVKPHCDKCNPTVEKKPAKDAAECKAKAEEAAKIVRKGTLTAKKVSAKFDGADAGNASSNSECK
jgi:hypothetical protein